MATETAVFAVRSAKPCFAGLLVCKFFAVRYPAKHNIGFVIKSCEKDNSTIFQVIAKQLVVLQRAQQNFA